MVETYFPSAAELERSQWRTRAILAGLVFLCAIVVFGVMGTYMLLIPKANGMIAALVGTALFFTLALPITVWMKPHAGLYILFFCAMFVNAGPGRPTNPLIPGSYVPFWINISTTGNSYGTKALGAIYLAPAELLMALTLVVMVIKTVASRERSIIGGNLLKPFAFYLLFVFLGLVRGLTTGGDLTMALYEVRPQAWWGLAYFLSANLIRDKRQAVTLLWIAVVAPGLLSIGAAATFASMGFKTSEAGITVHDDSLLFNLILFTFFIGYMVKEYPKIVRGCLVFLPTALLAIAANQRRAGIAAFIIAFLPLLPMMWALFPKVRDRILKFAVTFVIAMAIYMPAAWNSTGPWALPARAIRSQSEPSERDASSDYYRLAEEQNLKLTRNLDPWKGHGYGKQYGLFFEMAETGVDFLKFMPHHSILWVWMRLGHFGFLAFVMLIYSIIIVGIRTLKKVEDPVLRMIGALGVLYTLMTWTFGKYDLVFANGRQLFICGTLVGMLAVIDRIDRRERGLPETEQEILEPESAFRQAEVDSSNTQWGASGVS